MRQLELKIDSPENHAKALHPGGAGKVTVARKESSRWIQSNYDLKSVPEVVRLLSNQPDIFISQNRFFGPRRLISQLAELSALFSDLDYYRVPGFQTHTPEQIYGLARDKLSDANLPMPNLGIATGRGVALLWLHEPMPRQALPRWNACQQHIHEVLKSLGADRAALDAARVLRLVGTTNETAKATVRVLNSLTVAPYKFEELAESILPLTRAEVRSLSIQRSLKKEQKLNRPPQQFTAATLWEGRLAELQALRKHRHQRGKLPPGQRDAWLFIAGVAMSWLAPPSAMRRELFGLAKEVAGWDDTECKDRMHAIIRRAGKAGKGETITWNDQEIDARYRFQDSTIIEWLNITEAEMKELGFKHLVDVNIKLERKREKDKSYRQKKRQNEGIQSRKEYESQANERRVKAVNLREQGVSYRKIAKTLCCSEAEIRRLLKSAQGVSPLYGGGEAS